MSEKIVSAYSGQEALSLRSIEVALNAFKDRTEASIQCCLPGVVVSYDRTKHEATVKPLVSYPYISGNETAFKDRPEVQLKVLRLSSGGFLIDMPVKEGDTGWIIAADRDTYSAIEDNSALKNSDNKGVRNPQSKITHEYSFGFFIPDKWSSIALEGVDDNSIVIQNIAENDSDNVSKVVINKDGTIELKTSGKVKIESNELEFSGESKFTGNIKVDGNLQIGDADNTKTFKVFGTGETTSDLTIGGNNTVTGNSRVNGTSTVDQTLSVTGNATLGSQLSVKGKTHIGEADMEAAYNYSDSKTYRIGDIVKHNGSIYSCISWSEITNTAPSSAGDSNWHKLNARTDGSRALIYYWTSSSTYNKGEVVYFNNKFYMALKDGTTGSGTLTPEKGDYIYWMRVSIERIAWIQQGSGSTLHWEDYLNVAGNEELLSVNGHSYMNGDIHANGSIIIVGNLDGNGDAIVRKLLAKYPSYSIYGVTASTALKSRSVINSNTTALSDRAFAE